jgi:hypothetical protein
MGRFSDAYVDRLLTRSDYDALTESRGFFGPGLVPAIPSKELIGIEPNP